MKEFDDAERVCERERESSLDILRREWFLSCFSFPREIKEMQF